MPKVTVATLANLDNPGSAVETINDNFDALSDVIDTLVSRDGTSPNQMTADFDMNSHRISNLPVPVAYSEPARHGDIQQYVDEAEGFADDAEESADESANSADQSEASHQATLVLYNDFFDHMLGAFAADPTDGAPYQEGTIYFNTSTDNWKVWSETDVNDQGDPVTVGEEPTIVGYWLPFPQATLRSLNDVDAESVVNNQFLVWQTDKFIPSDLTSDLVTYSDTFSLGVDNVESALDYFADKTNLTRYDVSFYLQGLMLDGESLFQLVLSQPVVFQNSTDRTYYAKAGTAATATTVLTLKKNGTQFGTITWASSGTDGTFSIPGDTSFVAGDLFTIVAPGTADATLANVALTFPLLR